MDRAVVLVVVIVAGTFLAACASDGGDTEAPGGPPQPVSDYRADADQLCLEAAVEEEELRRDGGRQIDLDDRARQLIELGPVRAQLGEDLSELEGPDGQEAFASKMARAARTRGAASIRAGRLSETGGSRTAIARAAAAEHDQRLRLVRFARKLGLEECAERLDPDSREEITDSVSDAFGDDDPAERCEWLSERLLEQEHGDKEGCVEDREGNAPATSVELSGLMGIADVSAVARVKVVGGDAAGEHRLRLTFERGRYRLDKVI